jgi:hypothetical protein
MKRALIVLADDGLLGQASTEALWDSLYNHISLALYDESARWGDYRRDVHPYTTKGHRYTVEKYYLPERQRLHDEYFPVRSQRVLSNIIDFVDIDDLDELQKEALAINDIQLSTVNSWQTKRAKDTITHLSTDKYYTLQGQEVVNPTKGIYIYRGKKVYVK